MQVVSTLTRLATGAEALKRIVIAGIIVFIIIQETYRHHKKLDQDTPES